MGINIPIAADSRQFIGATDDMEKGLNAVADALDDLVRDSQRGTDKLEDGFKGVQDESEKTEKTFKDLARTVERESKDAGKAIDKGLGDGLDKASDGMGDFKDEAKSTAREGAASFSGEFSDVGDVVQETLANALGGFGPIGAAAGIAAAVGFGALTAKIDADTEAAKERVSGMYESMLSDQSRFLSESSIMGGVSDIITEDGEQFAKAQDIAAASGVNLGQVLRAMSGDAEAAAEIQKALQAQLDAAAKSAEDAANGAGEYTDEQKQAAAAAGKAKDALSGYTDELDQASDMYNIYSDAARGANAETQKLAVEAARASGVIRDMPNGKTIHFKASGLDTLVSDVQYAMNKAGEIVKGGVNVKVQATNSTGRVVF